MINLTPSLGCATVSQIAFGDCTYFNYSSSGQEGDMLLLYYVGDSSAQRLVRGFHVSSTVRQPGTKLETQTPVAFKYACCLAPAKDRKCE